MEAIIFRHLWPHTPLHRCDTELQLFTKYYNVLDLNTVRKFMLDADNENVKQENAAKTYRAKGNTVYKDKNYTKALHLYNLSITRAPRDSVEFGLALGNRSAVFFDLKMYKECLLDIQTLLRTEYPEHLRYKAFMRQSKCLLELNSYGEATKSLKKAQTSFDSCKARFGRLQIDDVNEKLTALKTRIEENIRNDTSDSTGVENEDQLSLPVLKDGENPLFLNASTAVDLKYNERFGRHVVANTNISTGDVLFVEKPYGYGRPEISDDLEVMEYCSYCFKQLKHCFIPCTSCSVCLYCSDNCRQASWDLQHKWVCPGERKHLITEEMVLALHILFRASRTNFNTSIADEKIYGNREDNYPFVNKLVSHKEEIPMETLVECVKHAAWLVVYLTYYTDYFDWLYAQPNRPEGSRKELTHLVGGTLLKLFLQMECNAEPIREFRSVMKMKDGQFDIDIKYGAYASVLYVSSAMLNHSCVPNAASSFYGNIKVVRAIKAIPKGTEVTVSYDAQKLLLDEPNIFARQLQLKRYQFTCSCEQCLSVVSVRRHLNSAWLCKRCHGRLLTIPDDLAYGKCHDCHSRVSLAEYMRAEWKLNELKLVYGLTRDSGCLEVMLSVMKKTLHKHNERFMKIYANLMENYELQGNLKKCVAVDKPFDNLVKQIYGPTSFQYAMKHVFTCLLVSKYCNFLKITRSQAHEKMVNQCNQICKETIAVLQYYANQENLQEYERTIQGMLAWEKPLLMFEEDCSIEEL